MRLRWVVDNPRGPKGGNNDVTTIFRSTSSALRNVKRGVDDAKGLVLELDLDDLPAIDLSPQERYEHAERMMVKWSQLTLQARTLRAPSGPLFASGGSSDELPTLPELTRADIRELAEVFAIWRAWLNQRTVNKRAKPYQPEQDLEDSITSILSKVGEAVR